MSIETNSLDVLREISIDEIHYGRDIEIDGIIVEWTIPKHSSPRPVVKELHKEPTKKKIDSSWIRIVEECKLYFKYMIYKFEAMITFDRLNESFDLYEEAHYIDTTDITPYSNEIKNEFVIWIQNEHIENRLFDHMNWKPFREVMNHNDTYLGYKKMFQYKNHYFQLALDCNCYDSNCNYCKNRVFGQCSHFRLAYYGWTDKNSLLLHPDDDFVPSDMTIPGFYFIEPIRYIYYWD